MFYFIMFLLTTFFYYVGEKTKIKKIGIVMSFLYLSLFSGLRYGVGRDYFSYENGYETGSHMLKTEIGYRLILKCLNFFNLEFYSVTLIMSFLTLLFIYMGIKKNSNIGWLSLAIYILQGNFFISFNIMRQSLGIAIFFYATTYIIEKKLIKYVFFILLAASLHKSLLLCLILYFIPIIVYKKRYYYLGIITSLVIIKTNFLFIVVKKIGVFGYEKYLNLDLLFQGVNKLGVGTLLELAIIMIIIFYKKKLLKTKYEKLVFNFYYLATILRILSIKMFLINRIGFIFYIFSILVIPNIINLFDKKQNKIILMMLLVMVYFIIASKTFFYPTKDSKLKYRMISIDGRESL